MALGGINGILAASVLTLGFSGFVILMAHPRLYWGNAGNDLTPAFLELPFVLLAGLQLGRTFSPAGRWWSRGLAVVGLGATAWSALASSFL